MLHVLMYGYPLGDLDGIGSRPAVAVRVGRGPVIVVRTSVCSHA